MEFKGMRHHNAGENSSDIEDRCVMETMEKTKKKTSRKSYLTSTYIVSKCTRGQTLLL